MDIFSKKSLFIVPRFNVIQYGNNGLVTGAYGNNLFAAATKAGDLYASSDGSNWETKTFPYTSNVIKFVLGFGNGMFIAAYVTSNESSKTKFTTSADLETWTSPVTVANITINNINYCNGKFYAIGQGGATTESSDGQTWLLVANIGNKPFNDIQYFDNKYFLVSNDSIYRSYDGRAWERIYLTDDSQNYLMSLSIGGGKYLVSGYKYDTVNGSFSGFCLSSENGDYHWAQINPNIDIPISSVYGGGIHFICGAYKDSGDRGITTTTSNCVNFSTPYKLEYVSGWNKIIFAQNKFVLFGGTTINYPFTGNGYIGVLEV